MNKKRIVLLMLIVTIAITCWIGVQLAESGQIKRRINNGTLLYNMYPVKVYLSDEDYFVATFANGKPEKGIGFSASRQPIFMAGLDLINISGVHCYLGKTLAEIEKEFGSFHVDIGSGFFMPSYFTEDGYLVVFSVNRSTTVVERIGKIDLLTGQSVECFPLVEDN